MKKEKLIYRICLQRYFHFCCKNDPDLSLRKFSKNIGISYSVVSRILAGKRSISSLSIVKLARHITELSTSQEREFLDFFSHEYEIDLHRLSLDIVQSLLGIQMSVLATIEEIPVADEESIAAILKLDRSQIATTLEELERLNFISRNNHTWVKKSERTFENRNFFKTH